MELRALRSESEPISGSPGSPQQARLRRGLTLSFWGTLAAVAVLVEGLPGHVVPFFSGDLAYHLATARTMLRGAFNGSSPYLGMPAYYGGLFPLALSCLGLAGVDPSKVLMAVSWFEPLFWLLGLAWLARALWPRIPAASLAFATLTLFAGGTSLGLTDRWVNAPNIAGQVFWPMFPRDVAFVLLLVAVGAGLRTRAVVAGVVSAVAISVQAQIGLYALALVIIGVLSGSPKPALYRRLLTVTGIALFGSSWWWLPRVYWALRFGLSLENSETRADLPPTLVTFWDAYAMLLPLALVGVFGWFRGPSSAVPRFLLIWTGAALLGLALCGWAPDALLSFRRALVLASLPVTAAAVEGLLFLAKALPQVRGVRTTTVLLVTLLVVGASVPTLRETRIGVKLHWMDGRYGILAYPGDSWDRVWRRAGKGAGALLASPSDSAMAWFRTGRPSLYVARPGYLKLGFNPGAATGWSEAERRNTVQSAFLAGASSLCEVARERHAAALLLRSVAHGLGVVDFVGGEAIQAGLAGPGTTALDRNNVVVAVVPARHGVSLSVLRDPAIYMVSVWQAAGGGEHFKLVVNGRGVPPARIRVDGAGQRLDFHLPPRRERSVELRNRSQHPLWLVRVVGFVLGPSQGGSPATVLGTETFCRSTEQSVAAQ